MPKSPASNLQDTAFFGHPRGLSTLFFTEMWERFSYYGMRAFLVLFMVASVEAGGLGFDPAYAGLIYGLYTSAVYLLSVPGGWIADRFLGQQKAVLIGGSLIMAGHIVLALPATGTFYLGLALVAFGTGLLKPNISTIVGQLYGAEDKRRDAGFSIFYMGINIGAWAAPIICGMLLAESHSFRGLLGSVGISPGAAWHFAFGAAAVGMGAGLVQYVYGRKDLGEAGLHPVAPESPAQAKQNKQILGAVLALFLGVPLVVGVLAATGSITITREALGQTMDYVYIGLVVGVFTLLFTFGVRNSDERRRLIVIVVLFAAAMVFWACFEQAGSVLTLFAKDMTNRNILGWEFGASFYQQFNSVFVVVMAGFFAWLWVTLAKKNKDPITPLKFALGMFFVGLGYLLMYPAAKIAMTGVKVGPYWLVGLYFIHTIGELCLSPVGLSAMSKLAPARWGGLVLGIWFLAASMGNYLAGRAVGLSQSMPLDDYFLLVAAIPIGLAVLLAVLAKPIHGLLRKEGAASPSH